VVRRCVRSRNLVNEEALAYWRAVKKKLASPLVETIKMTIESRAGNDTFTCRNLEPFQKAISSPPPKKT
jgi:hypothetical protein